MICDRCGYDNNIVGESTDPTWMYQVQGSEVKGELFHPKQVPNGWYDSPKAAKAANSEPKVEKKVDGRSKAARLLRTQSDDNSTGIDQ